MCLFCQIARGEIPAKIIKENDNYIAFLDICQQTAGHTLIIPKEHVLSFIEASPELSAGLIAFAHEVAELLISKLSIKAFNIVSNAGKIAGQTVMHYHLHLLPRYSEKDNYPKVSIALASEELLTQIYQQIIS